MSRMGPLGACVALAIAAVAADTALSWDKRIENFLRSLGFHGTGFSKLARSRGSSERPVAARILVRGADGKERIVASCDGCYSPVRWSNSSAVLLSSGGLIEVDAASGAVKKLGALPSGTRELLAAKQGELWFVKRDNSTNGCSFAVWKWDSASGQSAADGSAPCLPAVDLAELPKPGLAPAPAAEGKERFDGIWLADSVALFLER